jgi:hypothetical protein
MQAQSENRKNRNEYVRIEPMNLSPFVGLQDEHSTRKPNRNAMAGVPYLNQ